MTPACVGEHIERNYRIVIMLVMSCDYYRETDTHYVLFYKIKTYFSDIKSVDEFHSALMHAFQREFT